jgi:hypothetical protein
MGEFLPLYHKYTCCHIIEYEWTDDAANMDQFCGQNVCYCNMSHEGIDSMSPNAIYVSQIDGIGMDGSIEAITVYMFPTSTGIHRGNQSHYIYVSDRHATSYLYNYAVMDIHDTKYSALIRILGISEMVLVIACSQSLIPYIVNM